MNTTLDPLNSRLAKYDYEFLESLQAVFEPENLLSKKAIVVERRPKHWYLDDYAQDDLTIRDIPAPPPTPTQILLPIPISTQRDSPQPPKTQSTLDSPSQSAYFTPVSSPIPHSTFNLGPVKTPLTQTLVYGITALWWNGTLLSTIARRLPLLPYIDAKEIMALTGAMGGEIFSGRAFITWVILSYVAIDLMTLSWIRAEAVRNGNTDMVAPEPDAQISAPA